MRLIIFLNIAFLLLFLSGCKSGDTEDDASAEYYYTCPMHPSVISKTPGACPVCNMSLVKVAKNNQDGDNREGNYIIIDSRQQTLAGIETDTVRMRQITAANAILGTVVIDEEQVKVITSRAKGRIEKLFIKETGVYVQSGKPLYSIYSEQLLADQKEYLVLVEKKKSNASASPIVAHMLSAAKNKLLLWGLTEKQISALEITGTTSPSVTFFSPEAGYVAEVSVTEGGYVDVGTPLYKITSLNQVWVEAQLYSTETSNQAKDMAYSIHAGNDEDVYKGKLVYSNPTIEKGQKIYLLRIQVDNKNGKLIPGMLVSVYPQSTSHAVLSVPKSAILEEKMKTAWVKTDENAFEQRMITTGSESNYWVEILSGLAEGDIIVTKGAYLISSEFILKNGAGMRHEH